jgi:hypothetical protein
MLACTERGSSVIDELLKNKEWIFSGVGVFILGFVGTLIWKRFFLQKESAVHSPPVLIVQIAEGSKALLENNAIISQSPTHITAIAPITVQKITEAIDSAPPLQQNDIAKNYIGLHVRWEARLFSAEKGKNDLVRLTLDFSDKTSELVTCSVQLSEYRELGILPKGASITVIGKIKEVKRNPVSLEGVQLLIQSAKL